MTNQELADIKAAMLRLQAPLPLPEQDDAAAALLSARFLSEVLHLTKARGMTRRALATALDTSPSYITQLYQGDRLLNLTMAAKLERVLGMKFQVKAVTPVVQVQAEAHPVMLQKLSAELSGQLFASEQTVAGGQAHFYSLDSAAAKAAATAFA